MSESMNWGKRAISAAVLGLIYLAIFMWFRTHDVWNVSVVVSTGEMLLWTMLRFLFLGCLCVACLTTGRIVLMGQFKSLNEFDTIERTLCYFFVGSAVLRIAFFFIGLQGLYRPIFVFIGSLPLLLLFPFLFDIQKVYHRVMEVVRRNILETICCSGLWVIAALILGVVYFGSCQYSFDGDYLTHYGPYYNEVVKSGGLAPNDVWYQYFYSKGAGLFYFSMLITDRVGPLLVSFLHFFAATLLVYAIIKRACGSSLWAISTSVFMLGMMAWPNEGFFVKHHCETAAVMLSIVSAVVLMTASERHSKLCLLVACILQVSLVLYSIQASAYTLMFIAVYASIALFRRNHGLVFKYGAIIGLAGVVSVLSMLHDYSVTGLYEITPFRFFLSFWNQEIFSKWVSPYLMFYLSEGSSPELGRVGISGMHQTLNMYAHLFRAEKVFFSAKFWIIIGFFCTLALWDFWNRKVAMPWPRSIFGLSVSWSEREYDPPQSSTPGESASLKVPLLGLEVVAQGFGVHEMSAMRRNLIRWVMLPALIMCLLVFLVYLIVSQPISIMRLSEFVSMYIALLIYAVLIAINSLISRSVVYRTTSIIIPVILSLVVCSWVLDNSRNNKVKIPLKFALGRLTANKLPPVANRLSEDYPKIRAIVGEGSRIVSLNLDVAYGPLFLQDPGIMTEVSYAFGNRWHEIVFGDPDSAKKTLQELGINYFLVNLKAPVFGALPYSPLFNGQSLVRNFRIVWQLESRYLLTWDNGQNSTGFEFLLNWRNNLRRGSVSTKGTGSENYGRTLYDRVRYLYELNKHALHGIVRPDNLEKVEGWQ